jgi:hypothetical protein
VKPQGLRVRSRSKYYSLLERQTTPDRLTPRQRILHALNSPFTNETLPVRLTALFFDAGERGAYINTLMHLDTHKLIFYKESGGHTEAAIDIAAAIFDANGRQVCRIDKNLLIQTSNKTPDNLHDNGIAFQLLIPIKEPGPYQVRAVLYDTKSKQLGSAMQFIEIPDIQEGKLTLSSIVLAGDELPLNSVDEVEGMATNRNSNETAAVRIFKPGARIAWACQLLNARIDNEHKPQLKVQVRLFHKGRKVYSGTPSAITTETKGNTSRMLLTGKIHLERALPGYYAIQVIAIDMLAKEEDRTAVQSIDFEIQNIQGSSIF